MKPPHAAKTTEPSPRVPPPFYIRYELSKLKYFMPCPMRTSTVGPFAEVLKYPVRSLEHMEPPKIIHGSFLFQFIIW